MVQYIDVVAGQKHDGLGKVTPDSAGLGIGSGSGAGIGSATGVGLGESIETGASDSTSDSESVSSLPDAKVIVAMDIFESSRMQP